MITMAMQMRSDSCTCHLVDGLPRGIFEAPNDRGRHQGDDDDDHLDAGVDGHGDRRSAVRDSKRGDVVLVIIIIMILKVTKASGNAVNARWKETTARVRFLSHSLTDATKESRLQHSHDHSHPRRHEDPHDHHGQHDKAHHFQRLRPPVVKFRGGL